MARNHQEKAAKHPLLFVSCQLQKHYGQRLISAQIISSLVTFLFSDSPRSQAAAFCDRHTDKRCLDKLTTYLKHEKYLN